MAWVDVRALNKGRKGKGKEQVEEKYDGEYSHGPGVGQGGGHGQAGWRLSLEAVGRRCCGWWSRSGSQVVEVASIVATYVLQIAIRSYYDARGPAGTPRDP